ncbi:hypothetical protein HN014_08930 [Aquimarina sp. TRL1]|uniref:Hint domain-containing protein n=1 Tax=Aquimarina sp. (strain TRL1) TaxID=2736252 RepID=UPI00158D5A3E|nr:Hint domain-containing protein [Aquimarina sp. TRL1]QKX05034.1 hypothetical protein HN014_08930 [Aquimarina sp. TRL1]
MKTYLSLLVLCCHTLIYGQLPELHATVDMPFDFGTEVQQKWKQREVLLDAIEKGTKNWDNLSVAEQSLFEKYDETYSSMWATEGDGCSWYCGAGAYEVQTSSALKASSNITYATQNLTDFSYQTAWVEGVDGDGIGEYIDVRFKAEHPRVTTIRIANGYVKSKKAWKNNSRVKSLKMYVNQVPYALLHLKDVYALQSFTLPTPLGHADRSDFEKLKEKGDWSIRFEILSVYKGLKYEDTVISELFFDGLDVHCLSGGTLITMEDATVKTIESLKTGDCIRSYNMETHQYEASEVLEIATATHEHLIDIVFSNQKRIRCTSDHPFLSVSNTWSSYTPLKTQQEYHLSKVVPLTEGSSLLTEEGPLQINRILPVVTPEITYTIVRLKKNHTFLANGVITRIENPKSHKHIMNPSQETTE